MITGCYDLRLTCDNPECVDTRPHKYGRREDEFAGDESGPAARQRARKIGWWLDLKNGTAACPPCAEAGHRPTEPVV